MNSLMRKNSIYICVIISILICTSHQFRSTQILDLPLHEENSISIGVGSCYQHDKDYKNIFSQVLKNNISLWIWMGDAYYGDEIHDIIYSRDNLPHIDLVEKQVHNTKTQKFYEKLRNSVKVIGVWDDHDFGLNDSGEEFEKKHLFRDIYLDFIDEPANSDRRAQDNTGIY